MSQVRKWYIGVYGGEAQARTCSGHPNEMIRASEGDTFVLSRDHMAREAELKEGVAQHWQVVCDQRAKIDALQQRLTAAEEREDVLKGMVAGAYEVAAKWVDKRCDDYVNKCGSTDPDTGTVKFPDHGGGYVGEMMYIADGLRALKPTEGEKNDA